MPLNTQAAMRKDKATAYGVELQHRHFAFIAATIADIADANQRYETAYHFAIACRSTNKAFDHDRFMRACNAIKVAC
jgi:hypothetical protein